MHLQHHWQSYTIIKLIRAALNVLLYCVIILNEYLSERFVFYLILLFDSYVWKVAFSYLAVFFFNHAFLTNVLNHIRHCLP